MSKFPLWLFEHENFNARAKSTKSFHPILHWTLNLQIFRQCTLYSSNGRMIFCLKCSTKLQYTVYIVYNGTKHSFISRCSERHKINVLGKYCTCLINSQLFSKLAQNFAERTFYRYSTIQYNTIH